MAQDSAPDGPTRRWPLEIVCALACGLAGVLISILPHLLWWPRLNEPVWLADQDELLYLALAGQAYFNHPTYLSDPIAVSGGYCMYPWLQMGPGILIATRLPWGVLGISLVWRFLAGLSIGVAWYVLIRFYTRSRAVAVAIALFLLSDAGLLWARPLILQFKYAWQILSGSGGYLLQERPLIHPEWRIITPGLSMALYLVHLWLMGMARARPSGSRLLLAGIGFGLLFYNYFFYWAWRC